MAASPAEPLPVCVRCMQVRRKLGAVLQNRHYVNMCGCCFCTDEIQRLCATLPDDHPAVEEVTQKLEAFYRHVRAAFDDRHAAQASKGT